MQIDKIHFFIEETLRKARAAMPTSTLVDTYLHRSQIELFNETIEVLGLHQASQEALKNFKERLPFLNTPNSSIALDPKHAHLLNAYIVYYDNVRQKSGVEEITFVQDDTLPNALKSQIRPVSIFSPVGILEKGAIKLYPDSNTYNGYISYLELPEPPKYSYTMAGRVVTYQPNTSTQLQWSELNISKILAKTLVYLGVSLNDAMITQFANAKDKQLNA